MTRTLTALLCATLLAAGCSDPPAPPAPTPVAPTISETFTGTLLVAGVNSHQFAVAQVGGVKVSLTSLESGAAVGLGVGTAGTGTCVVISSITAIAGASVQLSGTATLVANYCVSIADVGNLVEPVTYSITVNHS